MVSSEVLEAASSIIDSPSPRTFLVQGDTVLSSGGDAALIRIRREDDSVTGKGLAIAVDCNGKPGPVVWMTAPAP